MAIDFWYSWNFVSIKDVIRTYNLTVRFSKSTINIKIFDEFVGFLSKLVWRETLFLFYQSNSRMALDLRFKEIKPLKTTNYIYLVLQNLSYNHHTFLWGT